MKVLTASGPVDLRGIGDNAPLPFDLMAEHINELLEEARHRLDGEPISTEAEADAVSRLLNMIRRAERDADEMRKVEKKPHDDAAKAVQARWKPILDRAERAVGMAKTALTPWLAKKDAELREQEEAAAREAAHRAAEAQQALAAAGGDLTAREDAEALLKAADAAERDAASAAKEKAQAKGGERTIALRTSYRAEITDITAFARWAWANRKDELTAMFEEMAGKEARHGPRTIPGLTIHTDRKAA